MRTLATFPLAVLVMGCATLPEEPIARALYVDLRKAEELSSDTGWVVDRIQLESNAEDVLRSACQVDAVQRDQLDAWLSGQIALHGGSAEDVYRKHGKDLSAAGTLLTLERTRAMLRYAQAHAGADCPFWIEPDPEFAGVQGDADRFVVLAETIGYGSAVLESDEAAIGGGGGGRLLFAHGFGPEVTLALGGEVGGSGAFVENDSGGRSIDTTFSAAIPVLVRLTRFSRVLDFELAPVFRFNPDEDALPPGGRAAMGVGLTTLRASAFMPYAVLWLGYEYHPENDTGPADHSIHAGTRVGVDWDP